MFGSTDDGFMLVGYHFGSSGLGAFCRFGYPLDINVLYDLYNTTAEQSSYRTSISGRRMNIAAPRIRYMCVHLAMKSAQQF